MASRNSLINDRQTALRAALDGRQSQIWTSMPAIITKVNFAQMTLEVQPAIQGIITDETGAETYVNLPLLVDVPIIFPRGGDFLLSMPLAVNDEVFVHIASRCIDSWWQNGGVSIPMEARMHDLSDAFAVPGPYSLPNIPGGAISSTAAQLRNKAGTAYLGISGSNKIQCANPSKNLKGVIDGVLDLLINLETALSTFSASTSGAVDPTVAGASITLAASLGALTAAISAYKTSDVGALLE